MNEIRIKKINLFIMLSLSCTAVFLITLIVTKGDAAVWLAMERGYQAFVIWFDRFLCAFHLCWGNSYNGLVFSVHTPLR